MTRARTGGSTVHLDVRDGLRFDPTDVGPLDVDPADVPALLATGAYVVAEGETFTPEPAVTADEPEEADSDA